MSRSFKDSADNVWHVAFNVTAARQLKQGATGTDRSIDILDANELGAAFDDPYQRFDLVWAACASQAKQRDIATPEDFDAMLFPPELPAEEAERIWAEIEQAVQEGLTDFFRRIGQAALAEVITKAKAARQKLEDVAVKKLQSAKAENLIDRAVEKAEAVVDREFDKAMKSLEILGEPSTK